MVAKKLLTAAEFFKLGLEQAELVDGEVVEYMPTGGKHGSIAVKLSARLNQWAEASQAGDVGSEAGFIVQTNPDRVRGPDIHFVRAERIPEGGVPEEFWPIAPDLAVEVISPSDTAEVIKDKMRDYFAAGTQTVWLVYPKFKEIEAHYASGAVRMFRDDDALEDPMLPGFACPLEAIFGK